VFIVDVVYFVIDSVRKLLDTPSYVTSQVSWIQMSHVTKSTVFFLCPILQDPFWASFPNTAYLKNWKKILENVFHLTTENSKLVICWSRIFVCCRRF